MLEVTVDREKWYRGHGGYESRLLREDGLMCCMGFACLAAGVSLNDIRNVSSVERVNLNSAINLTFRTENYTTLYYANDVRSYEGQGEQERETRIKELGERVSIEFTFTN